MEVGGGAFTHAVCAVNVHSGLVLGSLPPPSLVRGEPSKSENMLWGVGLGWIADRLFRLVPHRRRRPSSVANFDKSIGSRNKFGGDNGLVAVEAQPYHRSAP